MVLVCGADQGEILLIRDCKNDPAIGALKEIAAVVIIQPLGHDMRSPHQPHPFGRVDAGNVADDVFHPGSAGVHQGPRRMGFATLRSVDRHQPAAGLPLGRHYTGPRHDAGAVFRRIARVQGYQLGILDPAVAVFKGLDEALLQRLARSILRQIQRPCARQNLAPAKSIIEKQTQPDQPGWPPSLHPRHHPRHQTPRGCFPFKPHVGVKGQNKPHRPRYMRHRDQERLAFLQGFAHQSELEILQIAQPTMEQFRRGRRRGLRQIALFGQNHRQPASSRIARYSAAVDAAADYEKISHLRLRLLDHVSPLPNKRKTECCSPFRQPFFSFFSNSRKNEEKCLLGVQFLVEIQEFPKIAQKRAVLRQCRCGMFAAVRNVIPHLIESIS